MSIQKESRGSLQQQAIAIVVVLLFVGLGIWMLLSRAPFGGPRVHDFGLVSFEEPPHRLQHIFELTNEGSAPIQIVKSKSTCGCTQATVSGEIVQPGEVLDVPVSLRLDRSGDKEGVVTIFFDTGGSIDLTVRARGLPRRTLRLTPDIVRLRPPLGIGTTRLRMESAETPPMPSVTVPDLLTASVAPWKQVGFAEEESGIHPSWMSTVTVKAEGEWPLAGQKIQFLFPDGDHVEVTVNPPLMIAPPQPFENPKPLADP
jgi:hypothetical protein